MAADVLLALREEIGRRHGMSTALAALLVGETAAEIERDVQAFRDACGAKWDGAAWTVDDPVRVSAEMRRRRDARAERARIEREREGDAILDAAMQEAGWGE